DLYAQHPALNEAGLILYNHARTKQVKWDLEKVHQLIYKIYRYLKPHYPKTPYGYLHVEDTSLQYPGKKEASPAVAMVLTFHAEKPKVAASYTYVERQVAPYLLGNRQLREVQNLTDKHYGHLDLLQSQALIVLPADLSKIRPKVVEDQPAPDQAPSGELLREAKRAEINFWVQMVGKDHYNLAEIERAVYFMKAAHQHQTRQNKAPYYTHTLTVAKYASQHDDRPHVLMAALLHDVVEDTHVTLEEVSIRFGHQVAELVKLLSNTQLDTFRKYKDSDKQAHIDRMTQNRAALLIKACDCLHNLETLAHMPLQKQRAKAQETLDYYVPVLRAAGFTQLANQLEKLALRFL
ncbi:MAG: HD domain-containing protein, partial [Cytophagales bacterium]